MPGLARIVQHAPVQLADLEAYAVRLEHARVLRITEVDANFDRLLPSQIGLRGRDGQDKGGNAGRGTRMALLRTRLNSIGRQPSGYAARA